MNVAFVGYFNEKAVNGASKAAFDLALGLRTRGINVYFYSAFIDLKQVSSLVNGQFVHRSFKRSVNPFKLSDEFKNFIIGNSDNIDIFHFHSAFIPFFIPLYKLILSKGYSYVITPHGGYCEGIIKRNSILKSLYLSLFEKRYINRASRVICVTESEVENIIRLSKSALPDVIPNPVSFTECRDIQPQELVYKQLVYLGRYDIDHKGLDKLLRIFKKIEETNDNIKLAMYGDGEDKKRLKSMAKSLNLKNVSICEPIFGDEKARVLKQATAYVQMSNWEVFGMSIVEAMLVEKPVILSNTCALSKLLIDERAGLVVNTENIEASAQKIVEYLASEDELYDHGKRLKKAAIENFSIEKVSEQTLNMYYKVLHKEVALEVKQVALKLSV